MFEKRSFLGTLVCVIASGVMAAMACAGDAAAASYARLHSFCKQTNCPDGAYPEAGLVADSAGNFYGTTYFGGNTNCGNAGCGAAFELSPKGNGKYKVFTLHAFCQEANCDDGGHPYAGLIIDTAGNLYGTASVGGGYGAGSIFELVLNGDGTRTYKVLHRFCARTNCTDGAGPQDDGLTYKGAAKGLPYDGTSPLYGTAQASGGNGYGVVYELKTPPAGQKKWHEKVLYSFCSQSGCPDGKFPQHGLLVDPSGNLYGSTNQGGATGNGVIFELSKSGKTWSETVLYNVCAEGGSCTDGAIVGSPLTIDTSGNLYGTMANGANSYSGVLFKIAPNGTNSTYSVLYDFCSLSGCTDGQEPWGPLLMDGSGNIFGTTEIGGAYGLGTVYEFSGGAIQVLHSFCRQSSCIDGAVPTGGLITDTSGNLYGTTSDGCQQCAGFGTVFRLTP